MYIQRNREIKRRSNSALEAIQISIKKVIDEYDVSLQYHDSMGIFLQDYKIGAVLIEYFSHCNEFCDHVKCNKKCGTDCFLLKSKIAKHLRKAKRPIYGRCHLGMEEYIFPVYSSDRVIGYFTVGEFYTDKEKSVEYIKECCKKWGFNEDELIKAFFNTAKPIDFDTEKLITDMNLISTAVGLYIKETVSDNEIEKRALKEQGANSKNYVVEMAKEYITANFTGDVSLETIANICHCNSSYLSCIFKKKTGQSISEFVNAVRINRARLLLWVSSMSVTQISYEIGYNDSGYFSRVFKKITGMSPESFRKNMNRKK